MAIKTYFMKLLTVVFPTLIGMLIDISGQASTASETLALLENPPQRSSSLGKSENHKTFTAKLITQNLQCPSGTAPIYSTILVHGSGHGMLCAFARSEAQEDFELRKSRAEGECISGNVRNIFQEASRQESTACECSSISPNCTTSISQEFFCCGPIN